MEIFKIHPVLILVQESHSNNYHTFSARDISAAVNLARVFADRCIQYGITHMDYFKDLSFERSERVSF
jgi:hypothetical protein